jgi:hypothetical protein
MVNANSITRPEDKAQRKGFGASFARQDSDDPLIKPFSAPVGNAKDCPFVIGIFANCHADAPIGTAKRQIACVPFVADFRRNAPNFP